MSRFSQRTLALPPARDVWLPGQHLSHLRISMLLSRLEPTEKWSTYELIKGVFIFLSDIYPLIFQITPSCNLMCQLCKVDQILMWICKWTLQSPGLPFLQGGQLATMNVPWLCTKLIDQKRYYRSFQSQLRHMDAAACLCSKVWSRFHCIGLVPWLIVVHSTSQL